MKGKQSHIDEAFILIPPRGLLRVARVLDRGKHYEPSSGGVTTVTLGYENWRHISPLDHINHALRHITLYLAGDDTESHLDNATTRLLMALELDDPSLLTRRIPYADREP